MGTTIEGGKELDLSWLDYSYPADLSSDGKAVSSMRRESGAEPATARRRN